MKNKAFKLITKNPTFIKFIYGLIILNIIALIVESYEEIREPYGFYFDIFEIFSVIIFTIEYIVRIWVSDLDKNYKGSKFSKRLQFIRSPLGIIDLIAIVPFYLPYFLLFDLRVIRILRLFRLFRILKIGRYSKSLKTIKEALQECKSELTTTVFVAFVLIIISSTLMYYAENDAQPELFASIIHSFWWSVVTLTTVGYGDVYPITVLGKIFSGITALIGIGFVALPTGIISATFIEKVQEKKAKKEKLSCKCPNCGFEIK